MSKETAYEEMIKKPRDKDGKFSFSFDELASIVERHLSIPKERTLHNLAIIAKNFSEVTVPLKAQESEKVGCGSEKEKKEGR